MSPAEFKSRITKLKTLKDDGTLSYTEYSLQLENVLVEFEHSPLRVSTEDFLLQIRDLIENGTINFETLSRIKKILFSKNRIAEVKPVPKPPVVKQETKPLSSPIVKKHPVHNINDPYNLKKKRKDDITVVFLGILIFIFSAVIIVWLIRKDTSVDNIAGTTENSKDSKSSASALKVRQWLNALGDQNFYTAYGMLKGKKWGSYNQFSSTKEYGGVKATRIWDIYESRITGNSAEVIADYDSINEYIPDRRIRQRFLLQKQSDGWYITDIKDLDVKYYSK